MSVGLPHEEKWILLETESEFIAIFFFFLFWTPYSFYFCSPGIETVELSREVELVEPLCYRVGFVQKI